MLLLAGALIANNGLTQTLSAPATAKAGATLKINITGSFDRQDFVTIVPPDKPEGEYDHYAYARSATIELTAPETAGHYQIRILDGTSPYPTLDKLDLQIESVSASLEAPEGVGIGAKFKVNWQGPDNKQDFITIVASEAPEREYGVYSYTKRGNPVELTAPAEAGDYQIRYLTGGKYSTLARIPIAVIDASASVDFEPVTTIGGHLTINWTGPDNQQDFITIVPAGSEESEYGSYAYTHRGNPLEVKLPESPGDFEVRYLTPAKRGYRMLGSAPLQIADTAASIQAPAEAIAGSSIELNWEGPNNRLDFITAVPADSEDKAYDHYVYTHDGSPAKLLLQEQPGDYELRYLTGQERRILARVPLTIMPAAASLAAPASVEAGQPFTVDWTGPDNRTDYIAVTTVGIATDYHTYSLTRDGDPATVRAPWEPGQYELHYLTGQERQSLASVALLVTPSQVPGTLRVVADNPTATTHASTFGAVELILDASGSMLQQLDGQRRITIAKQTLNHLVNNLLPEHSQYALRVFGHRQPDACDTELLQPLAPLNRNTASAVINSIEAKNLARTPIADSLAQVANDLAAVEGQALVILVTDGEETCDGDPAQAIANLRDSGFDVRINIIGFAIDEFALKQEFARWTELGGGAYFDANNAEALSNAMQQSLELTYSVYDNQQRKIANGTVNGLEVSLPAGDYEVQVGEQRYPVKIAPNEEKIVALD